MQYAFMPFPSAREAGGQDICDALASRRRPWLARRPAIPNLEVLALVREELQSLPWNILVDFCQEESGDLHLAVFAPDLGRDIEDGDRIHAGFFVGNSETGRFDTTICERVYRRVCVNGALVECEQTQTFVVRAGAPTSNWKRAIPEIISRSFDEDGIDVDLARFRKTTTEMLVTPYEMLCHLAAEGLISEDERSLVTHAFQQAAEFSMYGLINAITSICHRLRKNDDWVRSLHMERLGGEILRGDHRVSAHQFAPR
jgi:hypothetical protein